MEDVLDLELRSKSHFVRNIVPDWPLNHPSAEIRREVVYVGTFGGRRSPDALLRGIAAFNRSCPDQKLGFRIVGGQIDSTENPSTFPPVPVTRSPFTCCAAAEYRASALAAVVDADDKRPVFLATKAGEAMHAARRVLFVTPPGSPARQVFDRNLQSVAFVSHDPGQIAGAIKRLMAVADETAIREVALKQKMLQEFRGETVARSLLRRIQDFSLCASQGLT
jgi:hypothetical protein